MHFNLLKDTSRENTLTSKTEALTRIMMNMYIWENGAFNQLFIRGP